MSIPNSFSNFLNYGDNPPVMISAGTRILGALILALMLVACVNLAAAPPDKGAEAPTSEQTVESPAPLPEETISRTPFMIIVDAPLEDTPEPPVPQSTELPKPASTPDIAALYQEQVDNLVAGKLLFNPPGEMTIGEKERVEVRIIQNPSDASDLSATRNVTEELSEDLQGRGVPTVEPIQVGMFMKVRLAGDGFDITPLSSEEQIVSADAPTQWAWDVMPNEAGDQKLNLLVTVRVKVAGLDEETRDYPVKDQLVKVNVNPVYQTTQFIRNY